MELKFQLDRAEADEQWDRLVENSPSGTVFSTATYLKALPCRWSVYYCRHKEEIRGGVVVTESANGEQAELHPFAVYAGAILPKGAFKQNRAQMYSEQFAMLEAVATLLPSIYSRIELALSPAVTDIRPFLWYRYGEDGPHYAPEVRYTAYAAISGLEPGQNPDDAPLFAECSSARRQEVRYGRKKGVITEETQKISQFTDYYALTMLRQGITTAPETLEEMRILIDALVSAGKARMFASYTKDGACGSMAVMATDTRRAYYLFGASDPAMRDSHCGSTVIWDAFCALAKAGVTEVDMEGINSPQRGWFKLSYGAAMATYYELSLK